MTAPMPEHNANSLADPADQATIAAYQSALADRLLQLGAIRSPAVERAFRRTPRHQLLQGYFLPQDMDYVRIAVDPAQPTHRQLETIYSWNAALATRIEHGMPTSSSSAPNIMATMLEHLDLSPGMRVLEVGAGTGYNAALLADLVGDQRLVTTIDIQPEVVAETKTLLTRAGFGGIEVRCADGYAGAPDRAPFDRIIATVGCPELAPAWVAQLAPAGQLLLPVRHAGANPLLRVQRHDGRILARVVDMSGFMAIQGALQQDSYWHGPAVVGAPTTELPLWPGLEVADGDNWSNTRRWGWWFYLGSRNVLCRITNFVGPTFHIGDAAGSASIVFEHDHMSVAGDTALLATIRAQYEDWRALGMPTLSEYRIEFMPPQRSQPQVAQHPHWTEAGPEFVRVYSVHHDT